MKILICIIILSQLLNTLMILGEIDIPKKVSVGRVWEREKEREVKQIQHQLCPLGVTQPAQPDLLQLQSTESEITLSYGGPGSTFGEISIFSSHSSSRHSSNIQVLKSCLIASYLT